MKENGTAVDVEMLRPASFVNALGLIPGSYLPLHLVELDVKGIGVVTEVTQCPTIQQGEGQVVTARFITRHAENRVRVTLSNGTEFVATDVHPVWSPENRQWTPAGELTEGTLVDTLDGTVAVRSLEPLNDAAAVYNIEVNGHHVYRVADVGVLVHNTDPACKFDAPRGGVRNTTPSPALEGSPYHPDVVRDRVRPPYQTNPAHQPEVSQ